MKPTKELLLKHLYRASLEINSGAALFLASVLLSNNIFIFGPMAIIATMIWSMGLFRMSSTVGLIGIFIFGEKP